MLEILQCAQCGGEVALADGDSVSCPFCHTAVPIPPAHRELRDAEQKEARGRTRASELYARWGGKPRLALRVAAVMFHPIFMLMYGLFLFLMVAMLAIMFIGNLLAPLVHANLWDTIPDAPKGYGVFALAAASVLGGMAMGVYGRRSLLSTRTLQAALAARPPKRPGGSATCRECGAPLHIVDNAEGVRCPYCHTDNLVAVPAEWLSGLSATNLQLGRAIEDADTWLAGERRRIKRSLIVQLGIASAVLAAFIGAIALTSRPTREWRALWSEYVKPPRSLVVYRKDRSFIKLPMTQPVEVPKLYQECAGDRCQAWLYVPLHAGEQATIEASAWPPEARLRVVMHSHFWWIPLEEGFGREIMEGPLAGARFTAPWSAWYQLRVEYPGPAAPRSLGVSLQP